ncbi:MAG: DUF4249 family protein [Bacteroidales bacterium]
MKTKKIHIPFLLLTVSLILWNCETDITVDLPKPEDKLIVEGRIESGKPATVFLTHNMGYFDPVEMPDIDSSDMNLSDYVAALEASIGLIYDSTLLMTVSDGISTDTLNAGFTFTNFPYFGYFGNTIEGTPGHNYRLEIHYNNTLYWAETEILQPVHIDSTWFTFMEDNDSLGFLHFLFKDPESQRNFYALELQTIGEHYGYFPPYYGTTVFDDEGRNGDTLHYTPLTKGYDSNDFFQDGFESDTAWLEAVYHKFGDEVNIKLSTINTSLFIFWESYYKHLGTAGNPFTNPATLKSNIEGGKADGYWGGYGASITNVTIDNTMIPDTLPE